VRVRGRKLGAGIAALAVTAAADAAVRRAQDPPVFTAQSEVVVLHVTVKDGDGGYVTGLPQEAFSAFEDGRPQSIQFFSPEDSPVTVGIVIDGSASMWGLRDLVIAAVTAFARSSHPQDEMFAIAFNESSSSLLPAAAPFTSDVGVLHAALSLGIRARGRTALYDAISVALDYVERGSRERKVLVLVSDGGDNASRATLEETQTKALASNAAIYSVGLVDAAGGEANPKVLKELAKTTGGEAFMPRRREQVVATLERIARDIRNSYTIGYVPAAVSSARSSYRRIRVAARSPRHKRLVVRARSAYISRPPTEITHVP
jgi:VWFA-related protein